MLADGTPLFYRCWKPTTPQSPAPRRAVLLVHRGHEHSGRFLDVVDKLGLEDCWLFAWDARGHGRNAGPRGYAEGVGQLSADFDQFAKHIAATYDIPSDGLAAVAHSIGAVVLAAWVHDYAPPLRAMALVTPAFRVKLYVPLAIPGLRLLHKVRPQAKVTSYVRPTMLTHDSQAAADYAADPLISSSVSVQLLLDLHDTSTRLLDDAAAIHTPTLLMTAGSDWVVRTRPQQQFFERLSTDEKQLVEYPGMYHDLLHETCSGEACRAIGEFIRRHFDQPAPPPALAESDQRGPSFDRWKQCAKPLPVVHPKSLYYNATRIVLGSVGQLSHGIRLGWQSGFNSGRTLDYVYENRARGTTPIGVVGDRVYLNSPGWSGIRVRRQHMDQLLDSAIEQRSTAVPDRPLQILDVAAGAGRYVMDAITRHPEQAIAATLCDQDAAALDAGRVAAQERGLSSVKFRQGDAFDDQQLAATTPRPDVAIVSGLFELFASNEPITRTLAGLARCIQPGGYLIYTNQPWHPQQELIARALHGYDGKRWAMRCRSTAEIDQLVAAAGFEKQQMLIDCWGIFTVSLAKAQ
nr:bifunctional alpha/beta hydrolase/class I SAM-dependent methyltransferase [Aeoliella straminimaris]